MDCTDTPCLFFYSLDYIIDMIFGKVGHKIQSIIIYIYISFNPFKWIYFKFKFIFLDFKSNPFNWIWIRYRLDTFLDYPNCILGWILTWPYPS